MVFLLIDYFPLFNPLKRSQAGSIIKSCLTTEKDPLKQSFHSPWQLSEMIQKLNGFAILGKHGFSVLISASKGNQINPLLLAKINGILNITTQIRFAVRKDRNDDFSTVSRVLRQKEDQDTSGRVCLNFKNISLIVLLSTS